MIAGTLYCLCVVLPGPAGPSPDFLLQRHQNALACIERFAVEGRYYRDAALARPEAEFLWARDGRRRRFQWRYLGRPDSGSFVHDGFAEGEKFLSLAVNGMASVPDTIKGKMRITGTVEPLAFAAPFFRRERMALMAFSVPRKGSAALDLSCEELFRQGKNVRVSSEKNDRYRVEGMLILAPGENPVTFALWFNAKVDYLVDEFILKRKTGEKLIVKRTVALDFVRQNGAFWPGRVEETISSHEQSKKTTATVAFVFSEIVLNDNIPEKFFNFRFPEGLVVDELGESRNPIRFHLYGKNNQVARTFTPEEYRQYQRKQAGLPPEPQTPKEKTFWPLVATLGLLALALGLALLWRRTGRTAPPGKEPPRN